MQFRKSKSGKRAQKQSAHPLLAHALAHTHTHTNKPDLVAYTYNSSTRKTRQKKLLNLRSACVTQQGAMADKKEERKCLC